MSELSFIRGNNVNCNDYYTGIPSLSFPPPAFPTPPLFFRPNIIFDKNVLTSHTPICNESLKFEIMNLRY